MAISYNGFKPGTAFTALIHAYGNIRLGVEAYGQLIARNLDDILNTIDEALDAELSISELSGTVLVPLYDDNSGKIRVTNISKHDLARCLQNEGADFNVNVNAIVDFVPTSISVSSSQIVDYFSRYVDQCSGMKSLVNQVVNSDFNLSFSQLYPTTIKGGTEVSEWLSTLIESTSGATNVLKVLSSLLSTETETSETKSDYIFNEDYTSGSSLVIGFKAIANDVTGFFDSLDFSWRKIGDSIKQLGIKIFDALKYLLSNAFVELDQNFVLNDKAQFETCDVPILYSTFPAGEIISEFPRRFTAQRYYFTNNNGYTDVVVDTSRAEQQEAEQCVINLLLSIKNNGNLVIPIAGNFVLLSLPEGYNSNDPLLTPVFCGVYPIGIEVPFLNHHYMADVVDGLIVPQSSGPMYPLMESKSQSNEDVVAFIAKSISHDPTVAIPEVPFGSNLETPNLFSSVVARSVLLNSVSNGGDLLARYNTSGCGANMALTVKFAAYAVIYYCIASDISNGISLSADVYNPIDEVIETIAITDPGFLPYCHTDTFECYVHAQTDTERANEVRDVIKKVLLAAATVAGATIAVKTKRRLKLKAKSKRAIAQNANVELMSDPMNMNLVRAAVKADKAAERAQSLSNIVNPVGIAGKMFSSLTSQTPNANQESRDNSLFRSLTSFATKYDDDKLVDKIRVIKESITG